ncbi:hypothetical protein [Virgibacillus proomii]|uniref:hypothetical protein n=1 Tax=Virgibacillus proomii TaxID=84407 RepID=UPI001C0FAAFE|nr:hypothetical protein [Virgibacillus proomii]MBU5265910.1 hypothetical protein [Virgibacillus proomii]
MRKTAPKFSIRLGRQDKKDYDSDTSHAEKTFFFLRKKQRQRHYGFSRRPENLAF